MKIRYYANGARFRSTALGGGLSRSDWCLLRLLRARDEWDVLSIIITGHPLPPIGGMGPGRFVDYAKHLKKEGET